ncbi:mitochondrial fission regulator 2 [Dunckerocampus dactyliophorus]|uniref:mitochondrial fission regulator 2 n=1 Tax=Dunckerocampus dactyliophorus TaxID=161453 RepID=UPI002405CAF5|nr:mitochondrial fission regulator 2 [Dunckerocampus dactyliophorus]XP_054617457.1 mitochondrial fission regulator 2 [Dunckerocampus dactyliophorus]XP_054617458.1 mitochondrial fission regulator 2 [Dunckerocampus dactyliophorus]XP_054617459.1 mitochondrial fission regulator 2 [Dunckerocampus dactyliophorus]
MSLLEDVLDVLRMVLEYFGVPPEMLVPVWDSPLCGQYRSIVRMIGSNLPLTPTPRVYFEIPLLSSRAQGYMDVAVDAPAIPSFADVRWVLEDEGESFAKTRNHLPPKKQNAAASRDMRKRPRGLPRGVGRVGQRTAPEALKKIMALEGELLKLRTQIAMIVSTGLAQSHSPSVTPLMSPVPAPALTSTPCRAPPPPPPPPPPPCPSSSTDTSSVLEMIRRRKCQGKDQDKATTGRVPSMLDVLKDLNQVKLRAVERSPGGTPVNRRQSKGGAAAKNDPASLIAEALKRKFAQHRHNSSDDKENSLELSQFSSPDTAKTFEHARRSRGLLHS